MDFPRQAIDYTCNLYKKVFSFIFEKNKYIAGILALIIANQLIFKDFSYLVNPVVGMDPFFIRGSTYNFNAIFAGSLNWGPLFQLWLKLIAFLDPSAVGIYMNNIYVCSLTIITACYIYFYKKSQMPILSLIFGFFMLVSSMNLPASGAERFVIILITFSLLLCGLTSNIITKFFISALFGFLASLVRPEFIAVFFFCFAVGLVIMIWQAFKNKDKFATSKKDKALYIYALIGLALVITCKANYGLPVIDDNNVRSSMAFREFFASNWFSWGNPYSDYNSVWQKNFGNAPNIKEAFFANPSIFIKHLTTNLMGIWSVSIEGASAHYNLFMDGDLYGDNPERVIIATLLSFTILMCLLSNDYRSALIKRYGIDILLILPFIGTELLSATLISARIKYLMPFSYFILLMAFYACVIMYDDYIKNKSNLQPKTGYYAIICLFVISLTPRPFALPQSGDISGQINVIRPVIDNARALNQVTMCNGYNRRYNTLTFTDGYSTFMGWQYMEVRNSFKGNMPFSQFLKAANVEIALLNTAPSYIYKIDNEWSDFYNNPEPYGFDKIDTGVGNIFIKKELNCLKGHSLNR